MLSTRKDTQVTQCTVLEGKKSLEVIGYKGNLIQERFFLISSAVGCCGSEEAFDVPMVNIDTRE